MGMQFEDLTEAVRQRMAEGYAEERAGTSFYRSQVLTEAGHTAFEHAMLAAIREGNETTLADALLDPAYWQPIDGAGRRVNVEQSAARLAGSEFNTWYVWAVATLARDAGEEVVEVYRAAEPKWQTAACTAHEGQRYRVEDVIAGHRIGYWPPPGLPDAFSIPAGPGCHHTIRRLTGAAVD